MKNAILFLLYVLMMCGITYFMTDHSGLPTKAQAVCAVIGYILLACLILPFRGRKYGK